MILFVVSGILFGIGCTVADLPGFISPAIVGALTFQNVRIKVIQLLCLSNQLATVTGVFWIKLIGLQQMWDSNKSDTCDFQNYKFSCSLIIFERC